jgi:hypothetical protein
MSTSDRNPGPRTGEAVASWGLAAIALVVAGPMRWLIACGVRLVLNFFGLLTPLIATIEAVLRANLAIGSLNISLG